MARYIHSRSSNGRFRRATVLNTFGLHTDVCPKCRLLQTWQRGEPKPTHCHDQACGAELAPAGERTP